MCLSPACERLRYMGQFSAACSEKETSELKAGKKWLTVTVGNWETAPKKDDPKVPFERISTDRSNAKAVEVANQLRRIATRAIKPPSVKRPCPPSVGRLFEYPSRAIRETFSGVAKFLGGARNRAHRSVSERARDALQRPPSHQG